MFIQILPYFLSIFSYLLPLCYFLPFKLTIQQKVILSLIIFINILSIGFVFGNIGVIFLIISVSVYLGKINANRKRNVCIFIFSYLFCVLWDNIYSLIWDTLIYPINKLQLSLVHYTAYILSYVLLLSILCPFISRIFHLLLSKLYSGLPKHLLLLIAANLNICLFIFLFNIVIGDSIGYSRTIITFNCILFACYFLLSTGLIVITIKAHMKAIDMDIRQNSYRQLQEYTKQIENIYSSLRSFKHDYSNIMLSISGYIETNDLEGLKTYFLTKVLPLGQSVTQNTALLNQLMNIKITELKSLISAKLLYAMELNIQISLEIKDEVSKLPIDSLDLTRIIGIFLDNAIEATLETNCPSIKLALIQLKKEYLLIVSNTFVEKGIPYADFAKPNVSTKGKNRGLGLYNAHELLAKYPSVLLDTEIQENTFIQKLHIIL